MTRNEPSPSLAMACGVCEGSARLSYAGHPGYQAGMRYDIYHCPSCDTCQAAPLTLDPDVYEHIYRNISCVPGYERYVRYVKGVLQSPAPLNLLASSEDVYWAVRQFLNDERFSARPLRVLDAGSGLGYLTYALNREGHDVVGLDISAVAVAEASRQFGRLFQCADIAHFAREHAGSFDVVIMTEVVEHVPDLKSLMRAALQALRRSGHLLITTPNKTSFAEDAIWMTENPPVHLWWLSETSMRTLASALGCTVRFADFRKFNLARMSLGASFIEGARQRVIPHFPVALDQEGNVNPPTSIRSSRDLLRAVLEATHFAGAARRLRAAAYRRRYGVSHRRPVMCAIFARH